jgi:choline dehydrogenase
MDQPNLTVLAGGMVRRILFQRGQAAGIEFQYLGKILRAEASHEVILSLGAIHTPKVLMQSGIGGKSELNRLGIPIVQDLPRVGHGLHDHIAFGCIWEKSEKPIPNVPRSQTACFWKTSTALDAPNFYAYSHGGPDTTAENAARFKPPAEAWSLAVGMRPKSRGTIHLTGPNPGDPVRIEAITSTIHRT